MTDAMTTGTAETSNREGAITDYLRNFARVRRGTLQLVAGLTDEQSAYTPGRDSWSVAQILDHLLLTEALYRVQILRLLDLAHEGKRSNIDISFAELDLSLPFIPKALMPALSVPLTVMNMFVPHAVREALLRFPFVKAKSPGISEPGPVKPIAVLREQMESSREVTESVLSGALPPSAGRVTVTHPLFGRNTIAKILALMAAHEERHGLQIRGIAGQPGFPAGINS